MAIIATADCETDPFKYGRVVRPFAWGLYDGSIYKQFWGDDCTDQFVKYLSEVEQPLEIYAHNGGKFDWMFLLRHLAPEMQMIGPRIVKASIGMHELRDSFAIMPLPLRLIGNKLEIDFKKLERSCREHHKKEITDYLTADCVELYKSVTYFKEKIDDKSLTMASAAMKILRGTLQEKNLDIEKLSEEQDEKIRPFYYGGRVQCFECGVLTPNPGEKFRGYDVNSMYPYIMRDMLHPISNHYIRNDTINDRTDFAILDCEHDGCLPIRTKMGIEFRPYEGLVFATGHEIRAALELGKLRIKRVVEGYEFAVKATFADFVNCYYDLRQEAKPDLGSGKAGDERLYQFYKLVMNSAYGKAALDPRKFTEMKILPEGVLPDGQLRSDPAIALILDEDERDKVMRRAWGRHSIATDDKGHELYTVWSRSIDTRHRFINVAMAASITGGARAYLMRGLQNAIRPIYCDTDSIICERLNERLHDTDIGAWKLEAIADHAAIAGKKMYALYVDDLPEDEKLIAKRVKAWGDPHCVKLASKGVRLHAHEIREVANSNTISHKIDAPAMKLDGSQIFIERDLRRTA